MNQSTEAFKLTDAMYDVFKTSKNWFAMSFVGAFAMYVIALVSATDLNARVVNLLAAVAVLVQMAAFYARFQSEKFYGFGEQIRRLNLKRDGIGAEVSFMEVAKILENAGKTKFLSGPASGKYFDSISPKGPHRLVEHLGECAFWTSALSKRTARIFTALSTFGFLSGVFGFVIVVLSENQEINIAAFAKILIPSLAFWSASEVTSTAIKFYNLSRDAGAVCEKADVLLSNSQQPIAEREALLLMDEYNCALASSLPIPDGIHRRNQDLLNELWSKKQSVMT